MPVKRGTEIFFELLFSVANKKAPDVPESGMSGAFVLYEQEGLFEPFLPVGDLVGNGIKSGSAGEFAFGYAVIGIKEREKFFRCFGNADLHFFKSCLIEQTVILFAPFDE